MIDRKRNLENLSEEQIVEVQAKLTARLVDILGRANKEANELLNQYGMDIGIAYTLKKQKTAKKSKAVKEV